VIVDDICTEAAPILRWTIGKTRSELRAHFTKRGWVAMSIADPLIRR
jgi:hypothetical protein